MIYADNITKVNTVIGIVSFGFACATPNTPGYYSSVSPQIKWINDVLKNSDTNTCTKLDGFSSQERNSASPNINQAKNLLCFVIHALKF